jgi:hypothetical protein
VKDRAALGLVAAAEASGALKPGGTVVEGTAGNTGIGLAHVCNARGYRLVIYMPDTQSQVRATPVLNPYTLPPLPHRCSHHPSRLRDRGGLALRFHHATTRVCPPPPATVAPPWLTPPQPLARPGRSSPCASTTPSFTTATTTRHRRQQSPPCRAPHPLQHRQAAPRLRPPHRLAPPKHVEPVQPRQPRQGQRLRPWGRRRGWTCARLCV